MSNKSNSKKKYQQSFFQKNKKWFYTGSFAVIIILILLINGNSLLGKGDNEGSIPSSYVGSTGTEPIAAPNFNLPTVDGKHLKLSDYKGKVLILDFWATWCPPCRRGIPDLIELKRKYGQNGFEVIGISVDTDTKAEVLSFVQRMGINYPVVYAEGNVTERYGGIESIPTSFVIDKSGKIVANYQGLTSLSVYENQLEKLLKK